MVALRRGLRIGRRDTDRPQPSLDELTPHTVRDRVRALYRDPTTYTVYDAHYTPTPGEGVIGWTVVGTDGLPRGQVVILERVDNSDAAARQRLTASTVPGYWIVTPDSQYVSQHLIPRDVHPDGTTALKSADDIFKAARDFEFDPGSSSHPHELYEQYEGSWIDDLNADATHHAATTLAGMGRTLVWVTGILAAAIVGSLLFSQG